jgi:hypothetical protein
MQRSQKLWPQLLSDTAYAADERHQLAAET